MIDFKKGCQIALDCAKSLGASYVDIRIEQIENETISVKSGTPEPINRSTSLGFGIRVIANGSWGFASYPDLTSKSIKKTAKLAVEMAKAASLLKKEDVVLSPLEKIVDTYLTPIKKNPFEISLKEKIEYLLSLDQLMQKVEGVNITNSFMDFSRINKIFSSSIGSFIEQTTYQSGAGIEATAMQGGYRNMQTRTYPQNSGQYQTKGYELIEELGLQENASKTAQEAVALLSAKDCPQGIMDLILDGSQVSLQIHESIGHPLELDRVFGSERNFSGTSFATPDKLNNLKYASDIVNVVNDSTYPEGLGTFGYDDEGVKANKSYLIKDGLLVGYLGSREYAAKIGKQSNGCMRAQGWQNLPIVRMTNTNLLPGNKTLEQMIAEIDDGVFMSTPASWSIDDTRENFKMGCEIGWEIKNGKLGEMVKNPSYSGNTIRFWNSCDAIADENHWKIWGTPNCGKGQPGQIMTVSQGASPARFRKVSV
ncbi:MAG: TldD/PmbA family protein [candidate division Zixibacteria bacterium]|nr:TldD/PmbA family protein [candidate division Zixibacteria bacterium]